MFRRWFVLCVLVCLGAVLCGPDAPPIKGQDSEKKKDPAAEKKPAKGPIKAIASIYIDNVNASASHNVTNHDIDVKAETTMELGVNATKVWIINYAGSSPTIPDLPPGNPNASDPTANVWIRNGIRVQDSASPGTDNTLVVWAYYTVTVGDVTQVLYQRKKHTYKAVTFNGVARFDFNVQPLAEGGRVEIKQGGMAVFTVATNRLNGTHAKRVVFAHLPGTQNGPFDLPAIAHKVATKDATSMDDGKGITRLWHISTDGVQLVRDDGMPLSHSIAVWVFYDVMPPLTVFHPASLRYSAVAGPKKK